MDEFKVGDRVIINSKGSNFKDREGELTDISKPSKKYPLEFTHRVRCETGEIWNDKSMPFMRGPKTEGVWGYEKDLRKI